MEQHNTERTDVSRTCCNCHCLKPLSSFGIFWHLSMAMGGQQQHLLLPVAILQKADVQVLLMHAHLDWWHVVKLLT